MKKLYVGGLPFSTTENELNDLMAPFGQLASVKLISDKMTGQSRGFGFVEMNDDAQAEEAIKKLNGTTFEGRTLVVNEARPMEARPRTGGGFRGGGFSRNGGGHGNNRGGGHRNRGNSW